MRPQSTGAGWYIDADSLSGDASQMNPLRVPSGPTRFVNVLDYGAKGDGFTDDTVALQKAIDDASLLGGAGAGGYANYVTLIPASRGPYMFSNLKLPAYTVLQGSRMAQSMLRRITGSTGNAIQEKSPAEGNPNGAISIWIRDLGVHGNGTVGNGIDLGFQAGSVVWETWGSMENVFVQGFTSGTGIHIRPNAISLRYIYALFNQDGVHVEGGYSQIHTVYAEQNSRYQLRASGVAHSFYGVHVEMGEATDPGILIEGGAQSFFGVTPYFTLNKTNVIEIAAGATKTQLHDVYFDGGGTFTHGIYSVSYSQGRTGTTKFISDYRMGDGNVASWYVNADSGRSSRSMGDIVAFPTGIMLYGAGSTMAGPQITAGGGTPEGSVTAIVGSLYLRTGGGASTTLYVKESGSGNTGWVAK